MAYNKIIYKGEVLIDLTDSAVTAETLPEGAVAYGANGERIVGTGVFGDKPIFEVTELPTENINTDAIYLCDGEYYKYIEGGNSWVFNEVLTNPGSNFGCEFAFEFEGYADTRNGIGIQYQSYGPSCPHLYYATDLEESWGGSKNIVVYAFNEEYNGTAGWLNDEYRNITIIEMPTDEAFLTWFHANAKPASGWVKYLIPTGALFITNDGKYDVSAYANVSVTGIGRPVVVDKLPDDYNSMSKVIYHVADSRLIYEGEVLISENQCIFVSNGDGTCYIEGAGRHLGSCLVIPAVSPSGEKVTGFPYGAFMNRQDLTSVIVSEGITSLGSYIFQDCNHLTSAVIGNGVTDIATAFVGCSSLTNVTIPESVISIDRAFNGCSSLNNVVIPNGLTEMNYTFYGCTSLTNVTIPESVTRIGAMVFKDCTQLASIELPESVTNFGYEAFYNCTSLTNINFKGTMSQWKAIKKESFWNSNVPATYVQCSDGQVAL